MNLFDLLPVVQGEKIKYSSQVAKNGSVAWLGGKSPGLGIKRLWSMQVGLSILILVCENGTGTGWLLRLILGQHSFPTVCAQSTLLSSSRKNNWFPLRAFVRAAPSAPNASCGYSHDWLFRSLVCLKCQLFGVTSLQHQANSTSPSLTVSIALDYFVSAIAFIISILIYFMLFHLFLLPFPPYTHTQSNRSTTRTGVLYLEQCLVFHTY